jgi:hypothetical protein
MYGVADGQRIDLRVRPPWMQPSLSGWQNFWTPAGHTMSARDMGLMYHAFKQVESFDPTGVATPFFSHPGFPR